MTKKNTPKYLTEATFRKYARLLDRRFDAIGQRFDAVDQRFEGVDRRSDGMDQRFDRLEDKVDRIALSVVKHESDIQDIKATMMTRDMGQEILKQLADFSARYEESERAARIHLNQLMEFRPVLDNHEKRLVVLEQQVSPKS
jgi:hypothetical protein